MSAEVPYVPHSERGPDLAINLSWGQVLRGHVVDENIDLHSVTVEDVVDILTLDHVTDIRERMQVLSDKRSSPTTTGDTNSAE